MAGLFGLFGGKKKEEDTQPKDAFFLDDESAKSMGDTEYMKASKNIRRTYPAGAAGTGHFEVIKTVSSMKASANDSRKDLTPKRIETPAPTYTPAPTFSSASSFGTPQATSFGTPQATSFGATPQATSFSAPEPQAPIESPSVSDEAVQKRRQSDDGMDMFRNMAKKVGK
jgi:hypothetical protein